MFFILVMSLADFDNDNNTPFSLEQEFYCKNHAESRAFGRVASSCRQRNAFWSVRGGIAAAQAHGIF